MKKESDYNFTGLQLILLTIAVMLGGAVIVSPVVYMFCVY